MGLNFDDYLGLKKKKNKKKKRKKNLKKLEKKFTMTDSKKLSFSTPPILNIFFKNFRDGLVGLNDSLM